MRKLEVTTDQQNALIGEIGQAKFDEIMNPKIELKDNTWYRHIPIPQVTVKKTGEKSGFGYDINNKWVERYIWTFETSPELWTEMTPSEIEAVLKRRCEELGYTEDNFECLFHKKPMKGRSPLYHKPEDKLWAENGLIYDNGKFAKKIETTTIELTENEINLIKELSTCTFWSSETQEAFDSLMKKISIK